MKQKLRGGIPFGILYLHIGPFETFLIAVITNILLVFPVFFLLDLFFDFVVSRARFFQNALNKIHKSSKELVGRYGFLGLMVFVAIPLPGTGAYAGCLAAHILGIPKRKAFLAISLGVFIAGLLVLAATLSADSLLSVFLAKV
ncbi:small multi-drug export protein [archaeon]|nr:small multi-drug export protein [archaeon]